MYHKSILTLGLAATWSTVAVADTATQDFLTNLRSICGHSYVGEVVESNASDEVWRNSRVVIHAPACDVDANADIRIPLHVGEDTSRTWIISQTTRGLKLEHDHRHKDGTPDDVSMYGGYSTSGGTATQQSFPASDFTKAMFVENGIEASITNTWTLTVKPNDTLSYRLSRPGRVFQVDFDLTEPVK